MNTTVEHYLAALEDSGVDSESLTILVVAGASRERVVEALEHDMGTTVDVSTLTDDDEADYSQYSVFEVVGGVLAVETTGYADPTAAALLRLSEGGGSAAVARSDIQAHHRFGCARDGVLLFDDDEYTFLDRVDRDRVPAEIRPLVDLVWIDPDDDLDDLDSPDPFAVSLAMAEVVTGVRLTAQDLARVYADEPGPFVRTLAYAEETDARREDRSS